MKLEVITGPMFSGKTTELLRRVNEYKKSGANCICIKPSTDNRYDTEYITTHDNKKVDAIVTETDVEALKKLENKILNMNVEIVVIDEANFFDNYLIEMIENLLKNGKNLLVAGLDKDFRGRPFGPMGNILAMADEVTKLKSVCAKCGNPATMTHRLVESSEVIVVGGTDKYEARCRRCHKT